MGKTSISIKGYKECIARNRKTQGGGLLIAKRDTSKINLTAINIHESEEHLWAKVNNNTFICVVYGPIESRTEKSNLEEWYYELEKEYIKWEDSRVMIIGDFNAKVGCDNDGIKGNHPEISIAGKNLRNLCDRRNLSIMNNSEITEGLWTREDPSSSKSVLDYVIANEEMKLQITKIRIDESHEYKLSRHKKCKGKTNEIKSDHNSILINFMGEKNPKQPKKAQVWNIKNQDSWANFQEDTENILIKEKWENVSDVNQSYKKWNTQIKSLMYKHLERITIRGSKITNRKIRNLTNRRKALSKEIEKIKTKVINQGIVVDYLVKQQQELKRETTREIENKRVEKMKHRLAEMTSKSAIVNGIWNIRKNNYRKEDTRMGIKSKKGNLLTTEKDINERYKEYFEELLKNRKTHDDHQKHEKLITENHNLYMNIKKYEQEPMNLEFTLKELEKAIKAMKKEKSPGPDTIYNEILLNAGKNLRENILNMINTFWKQENIPDELYRVEIKSIYKGKGDIGNLENHRGIFLNSNILKLFEKMILNRGITTLEKSMSPYQAGGRAGFSPGEQVFILRSIIEKSNYFNQSIYIQFIDLKKAFDKMVVKNIMQNIWESGLRGKIWRIIYKINEKAKIRIKINSNTTTDEFTVGEVLKQGSVLAANLAALHTDTLSRKFNHRNLGIIYGKNSVPLLLFQDDIVKFDKTEKDLQLSNIILERYQHENKMEYHPLKTMVMTNNPKQPQILLNNQLLQTTEEYKYLGDIITINNSLQPLISERQNIITGTVAEIVTILNQTGQYSILAAIQYLEGVIQPKLLLNSEAWNKISDEDLKDLEKIYSQSLKRLLHLPYTTPTKGLYSEIGIISIKSQIIKKKLMFLHRIMNKHENTLSRKIMEEQENIPGNNWLKTVKTHLTELNLQDDIHELNSMTKYKWKKMVEESLLKKEQENFEDWKKESKKCNHMKNIKIKNYIKQLTPQRAKIILEIRLGILDVKENYHGKYQDTICRNCLKENETAEHFIQCLTREKEGPIKHLKEIWKLENIKQLEEIANHCLHIMINNKHIDYKTI